MPLCLGSHEKEVGFGACQEVVRRGDCVVGGTSLGHGVGSRGCSGLPRRNTGKLVSESLCPTPPVGQALRDPDDESSCCFTVVGTSQRGDQMEEGRCLGAALEWSLWGLG